MAVRYLSIRLDDTLRERVKAAAAADRRSMAMWVALVLERALTKVVRYAAEGVIPRGDAK